jgi:hypothetical protein
MSDFSFLRIITISLCVVSGIIFLLKKNETKSNFFNLMCYFFLFLLLALIGFYPSLIFKLALVIGFEENERAGFFFLILVFISLLLPTILYITKKNYDIETNLVNLIIYSLAEKFNYKTLSKIDVLVVIPAFNELENLKILLKKIPTTLNGLKIIPLIIDDCSTDLTFDYLKKGKYPFVKIPINYGQGVASRIGYQIALKGEIKYIITMDADNQHSPSNFLTLLEPLTTNRADIVIGSRILGNNYDRQKLRSFGISFFSNLMYFLSNVRIRDISSGYKAIRTNVIKDFNLMENQFQSAEFLLNSIKLKLKIVEVPINFHKRKYGTTKKGFSINYALGFLKTIVLFYIR